MHTKTLETPGNTNERTRIVRMRELIRTTGVSRSTIYRLIADGLFPAPLKLSKSAIGWTSAAIQNWLCEREQASLRGQR